MPEREITTHKVNGLNEAIRIAVVDEPGAGGANHHYAIELTTVTNDKPMRERQSLKFQNGPIAEAGVNGISQEALLAIVIDRLQGFQNGPYKTRENAIALTKLEEAMHWLHHRTRERQARGVEGTSTV
jgi:hypothetical protein